METQESIDEEQIRKKKTTMDMTSGSILIQLVLFSLPLLLGNIFQLMYNTVDILVVGNFVGKEALAAVGSSGTIVNVLVLFFNGVSIGAGVIISQYFGAKDMKRLHMSIETTMALTFVCSIFFTFLGIATSRWMLIVTSVPEDVMEQATIYLRIYFGGISGLLIYNMGSGILRAVGDTKRPLLFLIFTSVLNIVLDLFFVIVFHAGISGVAYATIISQFVSAFLILLLLSKTQEEHRLTWNDMRINLPILKSILGVGLPAGLQAMITSFSNVFVQSYVNVFGSSCIAGWSIYNKMDSFVFLPMQSMSSAATTFVSQNIGAGQEKRANEGTRTAVVSAVLITILIIIPLFLFAPQANSFFTKDSSVIKYAVYFMRLNIIFTAINCVNHVLAGGLRGRGDSKGPMYIMLLCFTLFRQIYLYIGSHLLPGREIIVGVAYPVGWVSCCIIEVIYFYVRYGKKSSLAADEL